MFGKNNIVFAVDDEIDNVELVARCLIRSWKVLRFTDPRLAVEDAQKTPPAALVIDYRMPQMSGIEVVRQIRQAGIQSAVLMVTAFPDMDDIVYAQQVQLLYRIIPKPIEPKFLQEQVATAVAQFEHQMALQMQKNIMATHVHSK